MQALPAPTFDDVLDAAARLEGVAHRTPVLTSSTFNERTGASVFFKCENFQRMGAFKFRGAYNAISHFDAEQRKAGVLTYSSGNHAQAIALSARLAGIHATIIMPHDAPAAKVAATKGYGGEVISYDRYTESREEIGRRLAEERGMTLIPPYDHPHVIAGQGTAVKELIDETGPLDMLFVCLGGGGLIGGSALSAAALSPACTVIGIEPEAGNDGQQSLARVDMHDLAAHDCRRCCFHASRRLHVRDYSEAGREDRNGQRRTVDRDHAFFRAAHEDRGRADGLPRRGCRAQRRRAGEGQACGSGGERWQRRSGEAGAVSRLIGCVIVLASGYAR